VVREYNCGAVLLGSLPIRDIHVELRDAEGSLIIWSEQH
jgi:hypothetical protein